MSADDILSKAEDFFYCDDSFTNKIEEWASRNCESFSSTVETGLVRCVIVIVIVTILTYSYVTVKIIYKV